MATRDCLNRSLLGVLGVALAAGVGMTAIPQDAAAADKLVSEDEFSALFAPDPAEADKDAVKHRGLAKVPRPGFESKKREATTNILFETGSVLLKSPESFQQLDIAGRSFKKAMEVGKADKWVIEVAGHTDNVGNPQSNAQLSRERAEAIRQYLLQTYGLPSTAVVAHGYGDTQPIASNDTAQGREANRRVVFKVTQKAAAEQQ
ncbi:MAG: OmpA family protein [Nitrospirae bacterium]|nr:MAG: OmpA family protein [Nitrospirota bacterium]